MNDGYTSQQITQQTAQWLEKVVIGFNFCPFAKREVLRNSIRYVVSENAGVEACLEELLEEFKHLDNNKSVETTLIIYPNLFGNFDEYLDFVDLCQALLEEYDYEGVYQVASFHPDYCFAQTKMDDASNFTNRSPYPMVHLLREESLERVLEHYENPENIPDTNIKTARMQGFEKMKAILLECYKLG